MAFHSTKLAHRSRQMNRKLPKRLTLTSITKSIASLRQNSSFPPLIVTDQSRKLSSKLSVSSDGSVTPSNADIDEVMAQLKRSKWQIGLVRKTATKVAIELIY